MYIVLREKDVMCNIVRKVNRMQLFAYCGQKNKSRKQVLKWVGPVEATMKQTKLAIFCKYSITERRNSCWWLASSI